MRLIPVEKIVSLQQDAKKVRNVCILAHVDHGKTTLADSLLAANGVISTRLAGSLRFLDSRPDEQLRGITMKSSAVCICYATEGDQFLVNLIDSPGHVDFSGEVSTATRLCDGALLLVDVVEGVCPQTNILLKQAFRENIRPLLVLNKVDRLILELKMSPAQAYRRLQAVVEQINSVTGEIFLSTAMKLHEEHQQPSPNDESAEELELLEDSHLYFSPQAGNVVFASAIDGWGFTLSDFAKIYAEKLGTKVDLLVKTLWGDFYMDTKRKRIRKGAREAGKKCLFEQLVLENIFTVYDAVALKKDPAALAKIVASLQLEVPPRELRQADPKSVLKAVMGSWLPLADAVLKGICLQLPSANDITAEKAVKLMGFTSEKDFMSAPVATQLLKNDFVACDKDPSRPLVAFVSKMFAVERSSLPKRRHRTVATPTEQQSDERLTPKVRFANGDSTEEKVLPTEVNTFNAELPIKPLTESEFEFMAFARVYSGTLSLGQSLYVLPPTYDPAVGLSDDKYAAAVAKFPVTELYLMMGKDLEPIDSVPAGNVCAIGGLSDLILKVGTLSNTLACPPFGDLAPSAEPILKVAIEPTNSSDLQRLINGLKLLNQADPSVKISTQDTGEQVLMCAGEVHLQRCLEDLKTRYSNIDLVVSEPIVPFMETIVTPTKAETEANSHMLKPLTTKTANKQCSFAIRAVPLPDPIVSLLEKHGETLAQVEKCLRWDSGNRKDQTEGQRILGEAFEESLRDFLAEFDRINNVLKESGEESHRLWNEADVKGDQIWAFGPKRARENLLLNNVSDYNRPNILELSRTMTKVNLRDFDHSVVNGFQLRCNQGPLCEEPLRGVAFIVERWEITTGTDAAEESAKDIYGPLSGQIITAVKEGCKRAFQRLPQRLMLATYKCAILCQSAVALGKVYAVVGRRCGQVLGEEMSEGSAVFQVSAILPVAESFGFAEEIRKKTSGLATPQMTFSHWEVLNVDPFWVPKTEEELEHFGEKADSQNRARNYMNSVRRRKGLLTDEKIVEFAEKQRTLNKKVG